MTVRLAFLALLLLLVPAVVSGQMPEPDLGPVGDAIDDAAGTVVPPVLDGVESATGQQIDREDIQLLMDMEFQKGEVNLLGFMVGSGRTEIGMQLDVRMELRVVSSERVRALFEGESPYNVTAENATFLSELYLPADVLRSTFTSQLLTQFQAEQEDALEGYLRKSFPEMDIQHITFAWSNTSPMSVPDDDDVTEPPIVAELSVGLQYVRVDSVESLLRTYFNADEDPSEKKQAIRKLKADAADPLRSRDFFSAVAYSQLLNLTVQPGWAIDVDLSLPRGYEFTYFNAAVDEEGPRDASIHLDALDRDTSQHKVFIASISHKRGIALTMFVVMWGIGVLLALPGRILYGRRLQRVSGERSR